MSLDLTGIHNVGEFYSHHYLEAVLGSDLKEVFKRWREREKDDGRPTPYKKFSRLSESFFKTKLQATEEKDPVERWRLAREFHAKVLEEAFGYTYKPTAETLPDGEWLPLLFSQERDGRPFLWAVDSGFVNEEDESPLDQIPLLEQLPEKFRGEPEETPLAQGTWRELLDDVVFKQESPPRWVLFFGGDDILLVDGYKWGQGKFLRFELPDLLSRKNKDALRATTALLHQEVLNPEDDVCLLDQLDENNHKHAYAVSADLKYGAREAIELLGNEAIRYKREISKEGVFNNDELAQQVTEECLTYLYRLLFLFYVEARGPELGVSPMNADAFRQGYSLETLRDLEMVPLTTTEAQDGFYIHYSLEKLFDLVQHGFPRQASARDAAGQLVLTEMDDEIHHSGFVMKGLFSPIFDPKRTPLLRGVKFRNCVLQQVLQLLSLSKEGKRKDRGRISYAQLGINQLGSVYEGLLSYTGFFATVDLYEVRRAKEVKDDEARTFFVPVSESGVFDEKEFVKNEHDRKIVHPKGSYLFRLSGREREKSASFYTPEVLTRCLVKYTLKERLGPAAGGPAAGELGLSSDEILKLTVCEPAMGSGAFLNEVVNQLAHAYLEKRQEETQESIPSDQYAQEWQKVKYHFTCHNCYGVDKNPRALELAKLSLWLNTLHSDFQTPYLDQRLATGDSLIGARRQSYHRADLVRKSKKDNWLSKAPERGRAEHQVYHFLVPYDGMADFEKDKNVKSLEKDAIDRMKEWRKEMAEPFTPQECDSLERISARIDDLWEQHARERQSVLDQIRQPINLWGQATDAENRLAYSVDESAQAAARLTRGTSAGKRLKAIMDYWCALWFWPLDQAELLPSRDEWLMELDWLMDNDVDSPTANLPRLRVVKQVAQRVRFVHWELVFAEVFAKRGGFDIIVGNPPWVKVEWKEGGVLGDIAPELEVKKISASETAKRREEVLKGDEERALYLGEYQEITGTANFLGSHANMPLLVGQKNNLYKCFLVFNWHLLNEDGMEGLVHQTGPFDDPKGGILRQELCHRLKWFCQYQNKLLLFEGVEDQKRYCTTITGGARTEPNFVICSNLVHPKTLEDSLIHDGYGQVPGIKNEEGNWDLRGHRSRIVEVDEEALGLFASLYDSPGTPAVEARIPVVHSAEILSVLRKFAQVERRLGDLGDDYFSTQCLNETLQQKDGTIRREIRFPGSILEWIVSGPHFYVGTPFNKTPNEGCKHNQDYTVIDHTTIPDDYLPRTNYVPDCDPAEFVKRTPHWRGKAVTEFYRHVNRTMVAPTGERTLVPAILPPGCNHIDLCFTITFAKTDDLLLFSGLSSSVVVDFYVKSSGKNHVRNDVASILPLQAKAPIQAMIAARTLRLNCLTTHYADLWQECWNPAFAQDSFTKPDSRLGSWSHLTPEWHRHCAVRTPFERRQCLVELDALAALALNLTAEELCTIYRVQFPVLRMYERETYYDQRGMIIFTTNRGLSGVGLDRKQFEDIKTTQPGDELPDYATNYIPPFTRCDREQDMTQAYEVFQERLKQKEATSNE